MLLAALNAMNDLGDRCRRPLVWAFAAGLPLASGLLLAVFAPRAGATRAWETGLWLLAFAPILILSPLPWQARRDRRTLNAWYWALPAHLLLWAGLGPVLVALIVLAIQPGQGFAARYQMSLQDGCLAIGGVALPLGWMQAHSAWLRERAAWARLQADGSAWMGHDRSFDPDLLASHLRHLASQVEAAPARTVDGILALAHLYRQWLAMSERPLVALEEERRLLEAFVAAERFRSGGDLRVEWLWAPGPAVWRIPPFSLFSLASLLVAGGARHLTLAAETAAAGRTLWVAGDLPARLTETPAWQGVANRLAQCLGTGARLETDGLRRISLCFPEASR